MSLEVDIYLNNIKKFFEENPNDLINLIPASKKNDFYNEIKKVAEINFEKFGEAGLTKKQLLEISLKLGTTNITPQNVIKKTLFGEYSLN